MKKVYLIAVVFALLAMFATFMFANQLDKKTTIKDTEVVYAAAQEIADNTQITEEMIAEDAGWFKQVNVIDGTVNDSMVKDLKDIVGKVTSTTIYQDEMINTNRLLDEDSPNVGLSQKLEKGHVAYSFSAGSVNGVDGYIRLGDTVDVIVYEKDSSGNTKTRVAYKNLKILRVSNASADASASESGSPISDYGTLTVEVTEAQALRLYEIESDYTFKLVLNPRAQAEKTTKAATQETTKE
ncbi:MAG: Flp pilus assembly protein CpaB [Eubacterium sp.]|nr:Flp pilus assembly protein CpaB [Eubacterium sp.]MBR2278306.1 Flp pilus assembly protein CpaB [Eubacterium sp.]